MRLVIDISSVEGLFISLLHNIVACGNYLPSEMTVKTDCTDLYL